LDYRSVPEPSISPDAIRASHEPYAGVLLVLLLAGTAASAHPTRRATRSDPVEVLQAD
jgi:ABC-type lipoprotein release transport system permease subunit